MRIVVNKESEIKELFKEAIHIHAHLRYFTLKWEAEYGAYEKERKKFWEQKQADLLARICVEPLPSQLKAIEIEVKTEEQ